MCVRAAECMEKEMSSLICIFLANIFMQTPLCLCFPSCFIFLCNEQKHGSLTHTKRSGLINHQLG